MPETRWMVRYEKGCPEDENGDADFDRMRYGHETTATKEEATLVAARLIQNGQTFFGVATIQPFRPVTVAEIWADAADDDGGDLQWWKEDGRFYAYCGEAEQLDG